MHSFKTGKPGTLHALACCNIHGLWDPQVERREERGDEKKGRYSAYRRSGVDRESARRQGPHHQRQWRSQGHAL
ncbi:MAG: hypothetical protein FJ014_09075 [Chloroflexi bacterium]|nr:hypothetical protein [Chloroflexota bacterium]